MSRDDCGDCADLGEQLDQCEADAEEFCLRIAALEGGRQVEQEMLRNAAARIQELEAAMRRIVESGAYPEAAIAAEALDGAP